MAGKPPWFQLRFSSAILLMVVASVVAWLVARIFGRDSAAIGPDRPGTSVVAVAIFVLSAIAFLGFVGVLIESWMRKRAEEKKQRRLRDEFED
jgi:hypothetical protein